MPFDYEIFIDTLRQKDALREKDEVNYQCVERIEPKYFSGSLSDIIPNDLATALTSSGVQKLYQHQADAIQDSMNGKNVILESPTASGKTLAFTVPMIDAVRNGGTALMMYPMKAVAHDQMEQLRMYDQFGVRYSSFDGGMNKSERERICRNHPATQILLTSPEYLHSSFLWWARNHTEFLSRLSFLILDEAHEYRGYFGSHMAMLLRRFLAKLGQMDVHPRIFLATATCKNPAEHAEVLTGQKFNLISAANASRPCRHFISINHSLPDYDFMKLIQLRVVNATMACLHLQHSVLVFGPSVSFAEHAQKQAKKEAKKQKLNSDEIAVFHAGIPSAEKRRVQKGMRDGSLRVVFCTNALELGIDVGELDGVILAGFPDNIAAARQRIGRAGRSHNSDAFILYYPMNHPLDKFFAENPKEFIESDLDPIVADSKNAEAIEKHAPCAWKETGDNPSDAVKKLLGDELSEAASAPNAHNNTNTYYHWLLYNIRGGGYSYELVTEHGDVGRISGSRQFREAYKSAVLVHNGTTYIVESVNHGSKKPTVNLLPESRNVKTTPLINTKIDIGQTDPIDETKYSFGTAELRPINIGQQMREFRWTDNSTGEETVYSNSEQQYSRKLYHNDRHAFIMHITGTATDEVAIETLEQIMRIGVIFEVPADRHDINTHSKDCSVYLYENYPGGIGIARCIYNGWGNVIKAGIRIAEACKCKKGCAKCLIPPHKTGTIDKLSGLKLARIILESA